MSVRNRRRSRARSVTFRTLRSRPVTVPTDETVSSRYRGSAGPPTLTVSVSVSPLEAVEDAQVGSEPVADPPADEALVAAEEAPRGALKSMTRSASSSRTYPSTMFSTTEERATGTS